jgi:hypothetical protein
MGATVFVARSSYLPFGNIIARKDSCPVAGDVETVGIDPESGIKRELTGLFLWHTHWVLIS